MKKLLTTKQFLIAAGVLAAMIISYVYPLVGVGAFAFLGLTYNGDAPRAQQLKGIGEERGVKVKRMDELIQKLSNRSLTPEEQKEYDSLKVTVEDMNKRMRFLQDEMNISSETRSYNNDPSDASLPHTDTYRSGGKHSKSAPVFTYYKKKEEPSSGRNAVEEFYKRNFNFDPEVAAISVGQLIRARLLGANNDAEERALSEGSDSAGGYTVPVITSAQHIDLVRAKSHVIRSGAKLLVLESNDTTIAKLLSDPTAAWLGENVPITPSDPTFGRVRFQPLALKSTTQMSLELLQDSINGAPMLEMGIVNSHALELDRVSLVGNGTTEPKGIYNYSSPSLFSMGSNGGSIVDWDPFVDCLKAMYDNNCPTPNNAIMAPRTWATITKLKDQQDQPLQLPPALSMINLLETSSIPTNQDQGSATGLCSSIFFGGFEDLLIGQRLGLTIMPTNYGLAEQGTVSFFAMSRYDVQPIREESFGLIKGIKV